MITPSRVSEDLPSLRMREAIAYAMALSRWLTLEGRRADSAAEFWKVLQFATERLGFCQIRVQLEDGERIWKKCECRATDYHVARFDFRTAGAGILELRALKCYSGGCSTSPVAGPAGHRPSDGLEDGRTFRVISELLAECWHKASLHKCERTGVTLRFAPAPPEQSPTAIPLDCQGQNF